MSDTGAQPDRNVLGEPLQPCGTDPLTVSMPSML